MDFTVDFDAPGANTRILIGYRDASNYKAGRDVVLAGRLTPEQLAAMTASLQDGEFLIPSQVGLPDIQSDAGTSWSEDDHVFHTFEGIKFTGDEPTLGTTVADMVAAWPKGEGGWDVMKALALHEPSGYGI